jgi:hypothetical protein
VNGLKDPKTINPLTIRSPAIVGRLQANSADHRNTLPTGENVTDP